MDINNHIEREGFISSGAIGKSDLIEGLEASNELKWDVVQDRIKLVIRNVILSAISKDFKTPAAMMHYAQSR